MLKNTKIAVKTSIAVTLVMVIGFFALWKAVDRTSTQMVNQLITNQMTDAVESRTEIINNYVASAEEYMIAFAQSDEVHNVLRTEGAADELKRAQQYTVDFAKVKGVFEGLYIASTETYVYTHTSEGVIGIYTRPGDALAPFQNTILAEEKLTNVGIMKSPSSGKMVISMYYPVFEKGKCIGYVGAAVYANQLTESLVSLPVNGLPDCDYVFLNASTGEYLYNEDEALLCTVTEDAGCLKVLEKLRNDREADAGIQEYVDENGQEKIIVYRYIPDRDWVFALTDTQENVYSGLGELRKITGVASAMIAVIMIGFILMLMIMLSKALEMVSVAIRKLGDMDLNADEPLRAFGDRGDEIGLIFGSLTKTCSNLKVYIGEVDAQLAYMAEGDFTRQSTQEFVGEFKKLKNSIDMIRKALKESFGEISVVSGELVIGSQSVADSAARLAEAAEQNNILITEIDSHVDDISKRVSVSAELAADARGETQDASTLVRESHAKMEELSSALNQIYEATSQIAGISNNLEAISKQTNILALNALVEAARAGDTGKGFAVVADEIRVLAEESSKAAVDSYNIVHDVIAVVNEGLRIGGETTEYLEKVVSQTDTIDASVTRIADETKQQDERLVEIRNRLQEISRVVEVTSNMSQQSAAASTELDGQTNVLRANISRYRV